jgi:hypothetical protein
MAVCREPTTSFYKLRRMTESRFFLITIARISQPHESKKWLAEKCLLLERQGPPLRSLDQNKKRRNLDWSQSVIILGQYSVERGGSYMRKWVFRQPGQAFDAEKITS